MSIPHQDTLSFAEVPVEDPVCRHLATQVLPKEGVESRLPDFERAALNGDRTVYCYRETRSGHRLVCKFFGHRRELSVLHRRALLQHEFSSLKNLRKMGFCHLPHVAVRPIDKNEQCSCMLVEDLARGRDLDDFIKEAALKGRYEELERRLRLLAGFLARLHQKEAQDGMIDVAGLEGYFRHIRQVLTVHGMMEEETAEELDRLCRRWLEDPDMHETRAVWVHGDATPTNFFFNSDDGGLTAIDLERMHLADPAYDLGFLAAELRHHFGWRILNADAAEPLISRFFQAYAEGFPDSASVFERITRRNPFYMALGELRIARHPWLQPGHRKWLIHEAVACLRP